jgi:hypothetical protein
MIKIRVDSKEYITDDIYKYFLIENVESYSYHDYDSYLINNNNKIQIFNNLQEKQYYLILDFQATDAFFHFIAESVVYFPLFHKLKVKFPCLKIILRNKKDYHRTIGRFYNIKPEDFVYKLDSNYNVCIFTLPIIPLNTNYLTYDFKLYSNNLINSLNTIEYEKTIDILILPRQKKENYHGRHTDISDIINNIPSATILNTDDISELTEQIKIVKQSKIIIVLEGSAFLFNGLFAKNSKIIHLGDYTKEWNTNIYSLSKL